MIEWLTWGVAAGTLFVGAWFNWKQAQGIRDAAKRATDGMKAEAERFERSIAFEREKFQAESQRWREEKRDAKRAEVAAEVLIAIQRFLIAMDHVGSAFSFGTAEPHDPTKTDRERERDRHAATRREHSARWVASQPAFDALNDAWNLANVYLPTEASAICEELWKFRGHVWAHQTSWLNHLGMAHMVSPRAYEHGIGENVHKRAEELRKKSLAMLRPLAQLHYDPNEAPVAMAPARVRVAVPEVDMEPNAEPAPGVPLVENVESDAEQTTTPERARRPK